MWMMSPVRRALASDLGCRFCASFGSPPAEPADSRESLAIAFAEAIVFYALFLVR